MLLRHDHARWRLMLLAAALLVTSGHALADEPDHYVLIDILEGKVGPIAERSTIPVRLVDVDATGGAVLIDAQRQGGHCRESSELSWRFDRDVSVLRPDDVFTAEASAVMRSGDCAPSITRDPFIEVYGNKGTLSNHVRKLIDSGRIPPAELGGTVIEGALKSDRGGRRVYAASTRGPRSGRYTVVRYRDAQYLWFKVSLTASSPILDDHVEYEITYLYEARHGPPRESGETEAPDAESGGQGAGSGSGSGSGGEAGSASGTGDDPAGGTTHGRILEAARRTVAPGDTIEIPIHLINPDGVANMNFELRYDRRVAVVTGGAAAGNLVNDAIFSANTQERGRVRIGFAREAGLSAPRGVVAYLTFLAVGEEGSRTPLTLSVSEIDDPAGTALPIGLVHGEIVIGRDLVRGDCNGDGVLDAGDAMCALRMSVGLDEVDLTLDVNLDRTVTSSDAREILQLIP